MNVKVRNLKNKEVGEISLSDAVFGVELNEALIHAAVVNFQANGRQGTSATKTRGNVSGSGRKLWKQKGTGRARIASLRSPLWKGGGNVHGPQPRDWSYKMPRKMRRGALRSALSERLREGNLIIIDEFGIATPKTKDFLVAIDGLGLSENRKQTKTLIVDSLDNANLILSSRNVQKTKVTNSFGLNIYDLLYHEKLLISKTAIEELNALLDPAREHGKEIETEDKPKAKKAAKKTEEVAEEAPKVKKEVKPMADKIEAPTEEAPKAKTEAKPKAERAETPVEEAPKPKKEAKPKAEKPAKAEDAPAVKQTKKEAGENE